MREAAMAAARNAAAEAEEAWEAKRVQDGGFYGSDPAAAKQKAATMAASAAASAAERAVAPQDVEFENNPAPPVLRDRAAAVLLQFAENDPSNMDLYGGLPALEHAYIVMINTQNRRLELRGAMGLARLTHHPSDVTNKGAGAHMSKVTGSKRTVSAAGGVEALDGMMRRASVGYAASSLAARAARERLESAAEAEDAAAEAEAALRIADGGVVRSLTRILLFVCVSARVKKGTLH